MWLLISSRSSPSALFPSAPFSGPSSLPLFSLSVFVFCGGQFPHSEQPGQYFCSFRREGGPDNLSDSDYSSEEVVESTEVIPLKRLLLVLQSNEDVAIDRGSARAEFERLRKEHHDLLELLMPLTRPGTWSAALKGPNPAELMFIIQDVEDACGAMAVAFKGPSPEEIVLVVDAAYEACVS